MSWWRMRRKGLEGIGDVMMCIWIYDECEDLYDI